MGAVLGVWPARPSSRRGSGPPPVTGRNGGLVETLVAGEPLRTFANGIPILMGVESKKRQAFYGEG